jgi:nucleoside-diphosphate-sugar epimerase
MARTRPPGRTTVRLVQYFVTGGSGFLGRHLVPRLVGDGHRVLALARSDEAAALVTRLGAEAVRGDLHALGDLTDEVRGSDVVVHAAADTATGARRGAQHQDNVEGTRAVVDLAIAAGIPRLVHVSTEAVLADGGPLRYVDEDAPYPGKYVGEYSRTKALAEQVVLSSDGHDLRTIAVRPRLLWGPGDTTLVPAVLDAVHEGHWAWVDGGDYLTSTCHVANACEAIVRAAESDRSGQVYFVTDGAPLPFRDFITVLAAAYGVEMPERSVPRAVARTAARVVDGSRRVRRGGGEVPVSRTTVALGGQEMTVNDERARRELGYQPVMSVAEGLVELRRHLEEHGAAGEESGRPGLR